MQKNSCLSILSFILILSFAIHSTADFSDDVEKLVHELSSKTNWATQPIAVGLGSFFYGDSKISSDFAFHFISEAESAITNMDNFTLITRSKLDEILEEQKLQLTDLIDSDTEKHFGMIKGLDVMLTGNYSIWEYGVRVRAELIRIEDGQMSVVTAVIRGIPRNVAIVPPNFKTHKQRIDENINDWLPERPNVKYEKSNSDFHITIEPDQPGPYKRGDKLTLYVKSDTDCYIEIYDIAPDGSTHSIFPNEYWLKKHSPNENFIRAGDRIRIPYDDSFSLAIFPPLGVKTLKLIASTKPFSTRPRSFYQQKGAFPKIGDIDQARTVEGLKGRVRTVLAQSGPDSSEDTTKVAQSYCTILTKRKE